MLEGVQDVLAARIISEEGLYFVPAGTYVIDSAWILYAKGA